MTIRTGIWLFPSATAGELVEAVVLAERAGIDEVWIADEGVMRDPVVVLSAAATQTARIRLGVGITTPALRHPGAIASSMATLDELSGGRAVLGLGVGGELSLGPFGLTADRPLLGMRTALRTARAVLGRRDGEGYRVPAHAAPARNVPLYVASRGPRINELASAEADGVFVSGCTPDQADAVIGRARSVRPIDVALYQSVRFDDADDSTLADDPTCATGLPAELAVRLDRLVERHRPASVGLAVLGGVEVARSIECAAATFAAMSADEDPRDVGHDS